MANTTGNDNAEITVSYSIGPLKRVQYDMSGRLGNTIESMATEFYPHIIGKKINVLISELVNNVLENIADDTSKFTLDIGINETRLTVKVKNFVKKEDYEMVRAHVTKIRRSKNVAELMADTIRERREKKLKGGLGLIRLTAESKAVLSVSYAPSTSFMTITATFDMRELI